jgi:hypothetical protein
MILVGINRRPDRMVAPDTTLSTVSRVMRHGWCDDEPPSADDGFLEQFFTLRGF